jgi:hypothetical protein
MYHFWYINASEVVAIKIIFKFYLYFSRTYEEEQQEKVVAEIDRWFVCVSKGLLVLRDVSRI